MTDASLHPDDPASGGPRLHRQERPGARVVASRPLAPSRVAETRPTPLQGAFIYLSIVVLLFGTIAITALQFGADARSPLVRFPVLVGGVVLGVVTVDAIVRVWRSALAWLPVDRRRALFRVIWVVVLVGVLVLTAAAVVLVLG